MLGRVCLRSRVYPTGFTETAVQHIREWKSRNDSEADGAKKQGTSTSLAEKLGVLCMHVRYACASLKTAVCMETISPLG